MNDVIGFFTQRSSRNSVPPNRVPRTKYIPSSCGANTPKSVHFRQKGFSGAKAPHDTQTVWLAEAMLCFGTVRLVRSVYAKKFWISMHSKSQVCLIQTCEIVSHE